MKSKNNGSTLNCLTRRMPALRGGLAMGGVVGFLVFSAANAQQVQQGGSTGSTFTTPIGATLVPTNPAIPIPNPGLSYALSYPNQRGFVRAEPFFIYPTLRVGVGHVDNLNYSKDNRLSSSVLQLSPKVTAETKGGGQTHSLTYQGLYTRYQNSSADNFEDHEIIARTKNQFTARADLSGQAYYLRRSEVRGTFARASNLAPDQFNAFGANGTFGYGAQAAQGRFEIDLGVTDKTYQNNRSFTQALDVSSFNLAGRFLYRLTPRMSALAELRDTEINYKTSGFDNAERRALFGLSLDAGAAISGTAKIGIVNKNFKDSAIKDYTIPAAEVAVRWTPLTYSFVDLIARRVPQDTNGVLGGSSAVDNVLALAWWHNWQSYVGSYVSVSYVDRSYRGISQTDRYTGVNLGGYFDVRSWLRLSLDYSLSNRASSDSTSDYKRNALMFTVGATL